MSSLRQGCGSGAYRQDLLDDYILEATCSPAADFDIGQEGSFVIHHCEAFFIDHCYGTVASPALM